MADRRRLVRIGPTGTVTVVRDIENGTTFQAVKDSFQVTPGQRKPTWADSQRRYGGARQTGETHSNGECSWKILINGATVDAALLNVEALLGDLESAALDTYLEWRPDSATNSVYYDIRGPATWRPTHNWAQLYGAKSLYVDISIPVAPLALGDAVDIAIASTTLPANIALGTSIPGDAPALANLSLTTSGGSAAPIWALIGWTKRPTAPLATSVAPFGIDEAPDNVSVAVTWASGADANYRGGNGLKATTSGAGTASARFPIDPSTLVADDFEPGEIFMEVWARIELASTVVSPKLILSLMPEAGLSFGAEQYSAEFGASGKAMTLPSSGTRFRFVKLGTLNLPVDAGQPLIQSVKVSASWAAGSSGQFGLDYIVFVPARQRALSPSSRANDAAYPKFIASTGATTKTIRWDLSGRVASGAGNPGRDSGLGGSLLELPVGTVDMVIKLSSLVADDPTLDATTEQLSHTGVTGVLRVTPRYWLAKGA